MQREIERVRRWTARVFPGREEGYFVGAYISRYTDELMRDMRLSTRRAAGLLSEYLTPYWPERFARERTLTQAPDHRRNVRQVATGDVDSGL